MLGRLFAHQAQYASTLTHLDLSCLRWLDQDLADLLHPLCPTLVRLALPIQDADQCTISVLGATKRLTYLRMYMLYAAHAVALPVTLRRLSFQTLEVGDHAALSGELSRLTALRTLDFAINDPHVVSVSGTYMLQVRDEVESLRAVCAAVGTECRFGVDLKAVWEQEG